MKSMKRTADSPSTDPTTSSFLLGLAEAQYHPLVGRAKGTILLELANPDVEDHWLVHIDRGHIKVTNGRGPADAVVRLPHELLASAVLGCSNLWTAILRGDVVVEGDLHLVMAFQRLLPGPPRTGIEPGGTGREP